ncbi:MAG: DUF2799 domain-containing protein [Geminicoccaceae bacterium]
MRRMPLTILLLALGGCAGMGSDECRTADWRAIGYEDGIQGKSAAYFGARRKDCAGHGVTADFDAYLAGRAEGVAHFCRPQNGYHLGAKGQPDPGVCPVVLEAAFVAAHADGYGLYERGAVLDRLRKRLHHSRKRSNEIEYLLAERTALLMAPALAPSDRASVAVELKQLTEERIDLERAIDELEHDYAAAELEYHSYRSRIAGRHRD